MRYLTILTSLAAVISMFVCPTEFGQAQDAKRPLSTSDKNKLQDMLKEDDAKGKPASPNNKGTASTTTKTGQGAGSSPQPSGTTEKK
jgi:hypothetical protein